MDHPYSKSCVRTRTINSETSHQKSCLQTLSTKNNKLLDRAFVVFGLELGNSDY